ncbi:MAG: VanZ family protein [Candidatus Marinimicrobia bacterium]|jgi:VanZ family protein|nr:VanZ family protein [Candidatus Neomarinimicrobiota bacterium]MBT3937530.1 VanZ family protein [Candidatus Neomarinimicrobiota bacterium]MBT3961138.1 VanZ family protein [Candidatus Neomarinimicrobiota bacterium]MBT4384021.1 VanZ family protein [Candidatus Neomarinimicrobiota bacterium]MBT4636976.1 VanZ family protein [Candidatus Neomarinimicrobiota bacterium]|tara:strand:- start:336 stop:683 length:348 start_codon:yes stop_codon:yes gene_type:complete
MNQYKIGVVLYMGIIIIVSSIPGNAYPKVDILNADKFVHTIEYGILGFLLIKAFPCDWGIHLIGLIFLGSLFGIIDEWYQQFTPERFSSMWDALADSLGIIIGVLITKLIMNTKE